MLPVDVTDMAAVSSAARALEAALPEDLKVIASPGAAGNGPRLVVLRLVDRDEALGLRPELERLVTGFRQRAGALVASLRAEVLPAYDRGDEHPDEVEACGAPWTIEVHGDHCRFEDPVSGEVVEANLHDPDAVDPCFLLLFARTTGRHEAVRAACVEGFHDMCRLLDLAGDAGHDARGAAAGGG